MTFRTSLIRVAIDDGESSDSRGRHKVELGTVKDCPIDIHKPGWKTLLSKSATGL